MTKINTTNVEVSTITASWLNAKAELAKAYNTILEVAQAQYGTDTGELSKSLEDRIYEPYVELQQVISEFMEADFLGDTATLNKFQESYTVAL